MSNVKISQSLTLPLASLQIYGAPGALCPIYTSKNLCTKIGQCILRYLRALVKVPWQGVSWGQLPIRYIRS